MTPEDRILDRIKKLLRLSRSSNPHEAALALQRAMDLAQINGLRLASIDPDNEVAGIPWTEPKTERPISGFERSEITWSALLALRIERE